MEYDGMEIGGDNGKVAFTGAPCHVSGGGEHNKSTFVRFLRSNCCSILM
jgi:hypothetical protein